MNFSNIKEQLNIDAAKEIVDSILNVGFSPIIVIDKASRKIIYENDRAIRMIGNKIDCFCYNVFSNSGNSCDACPIKEIHERPVVITKHKGISDKDGVWQFSEIKWFDGRDAVMATILNMEENQDIVEKILEAQSAGDTITAAYDLDSLTHIPNYSSFYVSTEKNIQSNPEKEYAIIVFDIDRFKSINDLYGMTKGDDVLRWIGKCLKDLFGYKDNYARMHSDMFAFYMEYAKKGDIIKTIEQIRKKLAGNNFEFDINTTYGIYLVNDRHVPVNLMCDRAMMASKTAKGNVIKFCAFYDEQYREDMLKAGEIERDMHRALEQKEFKMFLQPKYRLEDGKLCGAEVLCRWLHPTKGIIPPMDFIPLFEKNGFILKVDEYMWEEACKTIRRWLDEGRKPMSLSVNISRYHIKHNNLEQVLMGLIEKYGLQPDMLTLEITESLFLDNPDELNNVLEKLRQLGFKLEVDDFGSGFSSLNIIRNISVDTIKIDKNFLDAEMASDKGKIVINHTIDMAKELELQVVAEGVETKDHVEFLRNSRCDIAQGFYFARPMPLEDFNKMNF